MADVTITLTIPSEKVDEFKLGFLARCSIPYMEDPASTPEVPLPSIPAFTDKEWIKEWLKREAIRAYQRGKSQLAKQATILDEGLIE